MPEIQPVYIYDANVIRVIDGDSCEMLVKLGFHITATLRFRLARINTAELNDPRVEIKAIALAAKARVIALFADPNITIRSSKPYSEDKFGRWLADIYLSDGSCVNDILLSEGLAKVYPEKF